MPDSYLDSQGTYVDRDAMVGKRNFVSTVADTRAYTAAESGTVTLATKTSATQTFTLPAVGLEYSFIAGSAAGEVLINPTGSVVFNIKASEGGAAVSTAAGTGIKNTAATNIAGDRISVISDGTAWYASSQSGIWATQ
jgi:hypothetical protein